MVVPVSSGFPKGPSAGGPIAEVDFETFSGLLQKASERPIVLAKHTKLTGYTYVMRHRGYYFVLKHKGGHDFSREAEVIPVTKFFQAFGMNTV